MTNAKKKILIIEDDPDIALMVRTRLEAEGYAAEVVHHGEEGLTKVKENRPDLIVLDVNLPDINGYEVCARIKSEPAQALPVVMLTSNQRHIDEKRGFLVKADAYIRKPMSGQLLVPEIRKLLRLAAMEPKAKIE